MGKKVTIKDIALESGTSIGTVDRILHNRGRFSEDTQKKVQAAIEKLGYIPKHSIPKPEKNFLYRIGVNYPIDTMPGSFWNHASGGVREAELILNEMGIELIRDCPASFNLELQKESIRHLIDLQIDALITTSFDSNTDFFSEFTLPKDLPFATVINKSWGYQGLFHIGPNDEAMGATIAKLISLYCGSDANVIIIAPSFELDGTNKRIYGFVNKVQKEIPSLNIQQIKPILAESTRNVYSIIEEETQKIIAESKDLNAIYITNGILKPVCDAVRICGLSEKVQVFGHDTFQEIEEYLSCGYLTATIYQNPRLQWYNALMTMGKYLLSHTVPPKTIAANCYVLTKETISMISR